MQNNKVALIIMDGWGNGKKDFTDAVHAAHTPFIDGLYHKYPHAQLTACGEAVGLPDGQMGNSEVGHLNLGAGRVVYQELVRINKSIATGEIFNSPVWQNALNHAQKNNKKIHLLGLVSDGGVHSSMAHLLGLVQHFAAAHTPRVFIHAFTDGRDTDPQSGAGFIQHLCQNIDHKNIQLATVCGRYYAMDRDKRWERVRLAYDLLVHGKGDNSNDIQATIAQNYQNGITDEFIKPIVLQSQGCIEPDDVVIFFNFRTDRGRELTQVLSQIDMPEFEMKKLPLHYVTFTTYDDTYDNVHVIFEKDNLKNTIGEVLQNAKKTQLRAAETEKYPHVTFFFSGGREQPFDGEMRLMAASPKVATYDLQPQMSAPELTQKVIENIQIHAPDFICLNYANPDMVGHTGVFDAIVTACQTVDSCVQQVVNEALIKDYTLLITADHGNADEARNPNGTPNTAHSLNTVPIFLLGNDVQKLTLKNGSLANVIPTVLELMHLQKPQEMTAESLLQHNNI
jgi:2,3-bisphosphoglycerate-independent phosphoglycerate mutase